LKGSNDADKLKDLASRNYKAQAIWFLNAFWNTAGEKNSETIWKYVEKIAKIDLQKGADGNEVDEMQMHRFLEALSETQTVREMRDMLRSKGAIGDTVKLVALIHYLIFRYNVDFHVLVNAAQGDNQKEVEEAQNKLNQVGEALKNSELKAQEAKTAVREAGTREAEAKAAKEELEVALKELKSQEDAFNNKTADLERKSAEGSVVAQNKAKAELAQHLASDPLPLRKAKITQEAAVKKADKAAKAAENARIAAIESAKRADAAVEEVQRKFEEAEAYLNEVRSKPGCAAGAMWWMGRELFEKKKYMPEKKGGIAK